MDFTWENGRNLKTIELNSGNTLRMKYNAQGMRIQKDDDAYTTNYFYNSQNQLSGIDVHGTVLYFYYDTDGNVTSFNHNGGTYYYVKDLQGDVIRIINESGTTLVTYTYDVWGNIINQTDSTNYNLANVNPYKYRGYVYDYETGLYYLNSRYYDPVTGRFINADIYCDTQSSILGTNMFTYCNNNPVNQVDPEGMDAMWLQFGDAVNVAGSPKGHTSLLLEDDMGEWWYFYWGPKHAILKPCGKDDFTLPELNSYLTGFDPRRGHNYYVYATNVIDDREDLNYEIQVGNRVEKLDSKYWLKSHDGLITDALYFGGDFCKSYTYAVELLWKLYRGCYVSQIYENPNRKPYESVQDKPFYHVCLRVHTDKTPAGYYYEDIKSYGGVSDYNFLNYNCVQVSMYILLEGKFNTKCKKYKDAIYTEARKYTFFNTVPNSVYENILSV